MGATFDLIYLVGCAVHEVVPDRARVEAMDLEAVHALSNSLELTSLVCTALEAAYADQLPDTPLFRTWLDEKNAALYKSVMFDAERAEVLSFLEGAKIWHLPSKGCVLQDLYPQVGTREMVDNDILYDAQFQEDIHRWFIDRGYTAVIYNKGHQDCYHKVPFYNFELHPRLFAYGHDYRFQEYYANVKDRLILNEGSLYCYHFSDDDFYIYMVVHTAKHYRKGGVGLRALLDWYLFRHAKEPGLNWDYIAGELSKLGVDEFELQGRKLGDKLFDAPERFEPDTLTNEEEAFLRSFVAYGSHGTTEHAVENKFASFMEQEQPEGQPGQKATTRTKLSYVWRRLFPEPELMKTFYPFFYRHKWLLPVGYVYRWVSQGVKNRKNLSAEVRTIRKL